jgi:ferrochelatase
VDDAYEALLVVSFGGPEGPDDVMPFLENVLRGKNVPRQRMLEVARHYRHFGGVSPLNAQNRALVAAVERELAEHGPAMPVYLGNRNWHPLLADTLRQMAAAGVGRALALFTSAYSSYSSCRQYLEDIERARAKVGPGAPVVHKLRAYYNHPGFIEAAADRVAEALSGVLPERRGAVRLVYTAHSIPLAMAANCRYEAQLTEAARLVSERLGRSEWKLVYQSRSGPPEQPWLAPDVGDYLRELRTEGNVRDVVIVPIGFLSDHMEILFDLDTEARELCRALDLNVVRAGTVGSHPAFVRMVRELVLERTGAQAERRFLGGDGPSPDICPPDCCPSGKYVPPARQ